MSKAKTILVIDDEPDLLEIARTHLESAGYQVITASTGREGLRAAKASLPDLIVLDIAMPEMNGLEMLEVLRGTQGIAATPVLMLTAQGRTQNIFEAEHLRVADFIIKPFTCDQLIAAVRKAI